MEAVGGRESEGGCGSLEVEGLGRRKRAVVERLCRRSCCCCFVEEEVDFHIHLAVVGIGLAEGLGCSVGVGIGCVDHISGSCLGRSRCSLGTEVAAAAVDWRSRMRLVEQANCVLLRSACLRRHIDRLVSNLVPVEVVALACCSWRTDLDVVVVARCYWVCRTASAPLARVPRVWSESISLVICGLAWVVILVGL